MLFSSGGMQNSYETYLSLCSDEMFVEDDDFLQAVENSLEDVDYRPEEDAATLLQQFINDNLQKHEVPSDIIINRHAVYKSTVRAMKRSSFSFYKLLNVHFCGEDGVDQGGPRREFFRLLMQEISESHLLNLFTLVCRYITLQHSVICMN